ncbi:unnamed protein product [Mytilus coruscus]|uniref:Uncharacterized protein n=1 Tax=Mytilus coruscus TaxID=42192 RepID=A0A6J8B131_MYTCO|nr:unnamed protein product [Mytilus coruscus]
MTFCQFGSLSTEFIRCSEDFFHLKTCSYNDIIIVLTEAGILPQNVLSNTYSICSSHFNNFLKQNEKKRNRLLCLVPSHISTHPEIDHTQSSEVVRHSDKKRKRSKCLQFDDVTTLFRKTGVVLPVGTPVCISCRKELTRKELDENTYEECSPKIKDTSIQCIDNLNESQNTIETQADVIIHETCQMEFDGSNIFSDSETIEPQSTQESQASFQREEALQYLNRFLEVNGSKTISSLPLKSWFELSQKSQYLYVDRLQNIIDCVIGCFFPENFSDVSQQIFLSKSTEKVTSDKNIKPLATISTIAEFYQKSESWQHRRQLLSMLSLFMTYQEVLQLIPDLTEFKCYTSKKHGEKFGYGLPVPPAETHRQKMDPMKLDSFLEFITSPHIIRDLPYGEKKLKLSDGTVQNVPNLIRCMSSSDIIQQYKVYCEENTIIPLGESTMYKILSECTATIRQSFEGVDYFVAEGGRAFATLEAVAKELHSLDLMTQTEFSDINKLLLQSKRYMKADFRVHVAQSCQVADHCLTYGGSDPKDKNFKSECNHSHTHICESSRKEIITAMTKIVTSTTEHEDAANDMRFKINQAAQSIINLKKHLVRCQIQDQAKNDTFEQMKENEVFIVCDWAMKFLPRKFREDQCDWFAKRGIPWHLSIAFKKIDNSLHCLGFIHIFSNQTSQDSHTTSGIIQDVITSIQDDNQNTQFHLWSDNAACYKSSEMMAHLFNLGSVQTYNFCEAQNGKGPCDRTAATVKSAIRRHINQGNDVVTANHMKEAIEKSMKNVRYRIKVVDNMTAKPKNVDRVIPSISTYSNFTFERNGIRVWKAYNIGQGCLISNISTVESIKLQVIEDSGHINFHELKQKINVPETDSEDVVICSTEGCTKTFASNEELTNHLYSEKCTLVFDQKSSCSSDISKVKYLEKVAESSVNKQLMIMPSATKLSTSDSELDMGWALKDERKKQEV